MQCVPGAFSRKWIMTFATSQTVAKVYNVLNFYTCAPSRPLCCSAVFSFHLLPLVLVLTEKMCTHLSEAMKKSALILKLNIACFYS
jgi:hypothetical protein